jgi:putative ABC transport system permease protein
MFDLALRTLRFRLGGFVATFVAVFFGAAIVIACGGLLETGLRTDVPPQRLAAAEVVVAGNQTFSSGESSTSFPERVRVDSSMRNTLKSVPGVTDVVPDVSFSAAVLRDNQPVTGTAVSQGHSWDSAQLRPYKLSAGSAPTGADQVVLDSTIAQQAGATVGSQVQVAVNGAARGYQVSGIVDASSRPALFFANAQAQRLYGHPGKVDEFGVLSAPGTDVDELAGRISSVLPANSAVALTGGDRGVAEFPEAAASSENLIVLAGVFGGMAIVIALFVVASTLGLTVQQRLREMALLRAIGTTPRQVRQMVIGESMVIATLATALGLVPGLFLGQWLFDQFVAHGVAPDVVQFHQSWIPDVAGVGTALLTAFSAAMVVAWKAASTRPTEALAEAALPTRWLSPLRLILALVFIAMGIALPIITVTVMVGPVASATAGPTSLVWAIGLALLAPGITRFMVRVLQGPVRLITGVAGYLATLNARARVIRLAAAVTPIMLATGIALANLYQQTTQGAALQQIYTANLRADVVLDSSLGLPSGLTDKVRSTPGVAAASALVDSGGWVTKPKDHSDQETPWALRGLDASGASQTLDVPATQGSLADLSGNTVAVPDGPAADMNIHLGDTITMRLGDNSLADLRVVALVTGRRGFETFYLPATLLAQHTALGLPTQILVKAAPGAEVGTALASLASQYPGVHSTSVASLLKGSSSDDSTQSWTSYMLIAVIVAYTAISVANTLVMATARRRKEFGLQRLTGSTKWQVMRMMSVESVFVAVIGIVLGALVSLTTLIPFSITLTGSPLPSGPIQILLGVVIAAVALTFVATLAPAWVALRPRPAEAAASIE